MGKKFNKKMIQKPFVETTAALHQFRDQIQHQLQLRPSPAHRSTRCRGLPIGFRAQTQRRRRHLGLRMDSKMNCHGNWSAIGAQLDSRLGCCQTADEQTTEANR